MGAAARRWILVGMLILGIVIGLVIAMNAASAQDGAGRSAAARRGAGVYDHWCAPCHAAGPGHPGTQGLQVKYRGELPAVLTDREDLTAAMVKTFVRQGVLAMAPFRKTEITDSELDDLAAYLTE